MAWPYHLLDLGTTQKHQRRILLDRYGVYAQLSALVPILAYLLFRLAAWVYSERQRTKLDYTALSDSSHSTRRRTGKLETRCKQAAWWLGGEVASGWGIRGHWIAGCAWTCWLLFLCIHRTGDDYLHITKRFGVVAASQLPVHYMLSMKSLYSPLALVFKASHEQLNPWHRLSGRIIYFMLCLHASWYMNYFVQAGVLAKRLSAPVVIIGITAFLCLTTIATTSLETVRRWSYRVFFVLHLIIGVSILPLLFFHAPALRIFVFEALILFIFDIVCRKLDTTTGFATITAVPHAKLVKIKVHVPASKLKRFHDAPGQHIYLSIPAESTPPSVATPSIHDLLFNPFTIAEVSARHVTLVLRTLNGPTTRAIQTLSHLPKAYPPINIEGPLGSSLHFPNLAANYDRILLIAGGVGATFILPIYRHVQDQLETQSINPDRVTFIWSLRSAAEASWAVDPQSRVKIDEDENVKIFLTGSAAGGPAYDPPSGDGSIELDDFQNVEESVKASGGRGRPNLGAIVDETFRQGNEKRVAVLVCGPPEMAKEVRRHVGRWIWKGRDVWFHDESFGW
ncbi:Uncharacterized protein BP5553_09280 [Venustampulla echinocandica]|uniref:FAD-binding FR-type domain-containing protein n=1 Tax=Venustampulla echinocandica TaxID=2656787 RepID=A0A370TCA1_9HELO|nr:Uncharacterized protein BP5553_09280 [Venustampulla echinocandica]RDL31878.1 Uncharacterized protein BP5553_09280 [Venustampulla echinocandica]